MSYLCILIGLLCASLSSSNKRSICLLYVFGLALELAVDGIYKQLGIVELYWDEYYRLIGLIDLTTLAFMLACFHWRYFLVYPLMFLMVFANDTIYPEWAWIGSTYMWSISRDVLETLNFIVLLIFFGGSDSVLRTLDRIWSRILWDSGLFTRYLLCRDACYTSLQAFTARLP